MQDPLRCVRTNPACHAIAEPPAIFHADSAFFFVISTLFVRWKHLQCYAVILNAISAMRHGICSVTVSIEFAFLAGCEPFRRITFVVR